MKQITSRNNAAYKSIRRLVRSSRARREEGRIVLDGVHLVQSYLERFGPEGVELVVKRSAMKHPEIGALAQQARSTALSDSLFDEVAPVEFPLGILAVAPMPGAIALSQGRGFQVLLDGVRDPGNVGAILRSAAAAGASAVHLSSDCADPWSPKCLRGGMGAQFLLAVQEHRSLALDAGGLGARLIACTTDAETSLFDAHLGGNVGFIVGGEGPGISPELLAQAQARIRVPMRPGVESLNVGAAAAVCFYEWARQANA